MDADTAKTEISKTANKGEGRKPWKRAFLTALRMHGNVEKAAKVAGVTFQHAYRIRDRSSRFAEAWKKAKKEAGRRWLEQTEAKMDELAFNGYEDPVYQGGQLVGSRTRYIPEYGKMRVAAQAPRKYSRKTESHVRVDAVVVTSDVRNALLSNPEVADLACRLAAITCKAIAAQASPEHAAEVQHVEETAPDQPPA